MTKERTTMSRARIARWVGLGALGLTLCGLAATAVAARALAPLPPGAYGPPAQQVPLTSAAHDTAAHHKGWNLSRSNTCGVEFRWRTTPDGWIDVLCREAAQPHADLVQQRHPDVAELRIGGATYPLAAHPSGGLGVRVPLSLVGLGTTRVEVLAWEAGADATDDDEAFLAHGCTVVL